MSPISTAQGTLLHSLLTSVALHTKPGLHMHSHCSTRAQLQRHYGGLQHWALYCKQAAFVTVIKL